MTMPIVVESTRGISYLDKFLKWYMRIKARQVIEKIKPFLNGNIVDVGMGHATVAWQLKKLGFKIEGVDVVDLSLYPDFKAKIYDGKKLPYKNKQFDTALLISVLHHCGDERIQVLKETMRVAKRVVMIEDTYRNEVEKWLVSWHDCISNWEFYDHKYLKYDEWQKTIEKMGGKIVHSEAYSQLAFGWNYSRYCVFVIE